MRHVTFEPKRLIDKNVLIIGDIMLDNYIYGEVSRISPEAPVPVFRSSSRKSMAGGAANVATNVISLGACATLVGIAGNDPEGATLRGLLADFSVRFSVSSETGRPTTVKTRYIAGSQQMLRVDQERSDPITTNTETAVLRDVERHMSGASIVVLSDYGKGFLTDLIIGETLRMSQVLGIPVVVDPKRSTFEVYKGAACIKPNLSELQRATGIHNGSEESIDEAARQIIALTGADVLLTRSEQGMSLYQAGKHSQHARAIAREVFDVSGAGDTALAAFAAGLAGGYGSYEAMLIANSAAGIAVSKLGTVVVSAHELASAFNEAPFHHLDRVVSINRATALCDLWRSQGLRIGFTNGCFDILHGGHVALLAKAATQCDRLIVGLNSDELVKRLKGPSRPVQSESSRAQVLASLAAVDLVVVFEDDTPIDLIARVRPELLVKGADYTESEVVGADLVKAYGGRIMIVDLIQGHSTTGTLNRVANLMATSK